MQTNYAHYPGVVGNNWPRAEQNPAYSSSVEPSIWAVFSFDIKKRAIGAQICGGLGRTRTHDQSVMSAPL